MALLTYSYIMTDNKSHKYFLYVMFIKGRYGVLLKTKIRTSLSAVDFDAFCYHLQN